MNASKRKDSKKRVVLFWPESDQVSIEDAGIVREEDRFVNFPTTVTLKGKCYKAIVRAISADQATLHEAEMIVANEIEERSKKITTETRTRQSRKTVSIPQTATTNQVAAALGERIKPRPAVEKEAQLLKAAGKDEASTRQNVELRVDANLTSAKNAKLTSAKKNLFGSDDEQDDSDNASSPEVSMDEDEAEEDEQEEKGDNNAADFDGCSACNELRTAVTKPVPEFLSVLQNFCLVKMGKAIQRNLDLKPIPSNMATTLLSKGFKVQIAIHDKNSIKSESEGNPNNIVRECLIKLYGKDQIESNNLTAKGTRAGTLGIAEDVRQAIKSFANRNKGPGYKDLTNANITKIINRKNNQLRRVSKGGSSEKKKKTLKRKGRSSKGSPPKVISPVKPDAPTPKKDEAKALIATSPWKVMEHSKGQINYSSTEQPNLHWGMHGDSWNATPSSSWQWQQHPTEQPYYGNNFFSHAQQQNSNVHQAPWHQDTNNYQSL